MPYGRQAAASICTNAFPYHQRCLLLNLAAVSLECAASMFFKTTFKFHSRSDKRFLLSLKVGKCHLPSSNAGVQRRRQRFWIMFAYISFFHLHLWAAGWTVFTDRNFWLRDRRCRASIIDFQRCTVRTEISPDSPNILILCTADDEIFTVFCVILIM